MRKDISDFSFIIMRREYFKDDYPLLANLWSLHKKNSSHKLVKPEIDVRGG